MIKDYIEEKEEKEESILNGKSKNYCLNYDFVDAKLKHNFLHKF